MSSKSSDISRQDSTKTWSCINCRRRKVRCDRHHPCVPCIRNKIDCVFPTSGRVIRRHERFTKHQTQKQTELLERLRRLESLVGDLGSEVETASTLDGGDSSRTSDDSATSHSPQNTNSGTLEVTNDGDLVIGDRFWTVFCKEVEQIFEAVHGPDAHKRFEQQEQNSRKSATSETGSRRGYYAFLLRSTSASQSQNDLNPLPSQIPFLWQTYVENVDPFLKVLHVPTMMNITRELRGKYDSLSPGMHALVLVISLAAIMSLENDEVEMNFNTDKNQLAAQYRLGVEDALAKADLIGNLDLTSLQAFAIYLSVLQHAGEMESAWLMAGVLIRAGVSMKLHLDSSNFTNISYLTIELRRRLWWLICLIDSRSEGSQMPGFKISESAFDTKMPTNINDDVTNMEVVIQNPLLSTGGWTDMTPFLIRCEIWRLSRRLQSMLPDISASFQLLQDSQMDIENTYLKHHDPQNALHTFVKTMTRLFFTKIQLTLLGKQSQLAKISPSATAVVSRLPNEEENFTLLLSIIEDTHALQTNPAWTGFRWQLQGPQQPPWHALRLMINHLGMRQRQQPIPDPLQERAWAAVKLYLDGVTGSGDKSDPRYRHLVTLAEAVQQGRDHESLAHEPTTVSSTAPVATDPVDVSMLNLQEINTRGEYGQVTTSNTLFQAPFLAPSNTSVDGNSSINYIGDGNHTFAAGDAAGFATDMDLDMGMGMDWLAWDDLARDWEFGLGVGGIGI